MKYFSHLCTAQDDDKHDLLFERYKFEGYGIYWWLCELVGRRKKRANDNPEYLFNTGRREVERGTSRKRIAEIIMFMDSIELIDAVPIEGWISIKIPKLNDYSAEWQKRLEKKNSGDTRETLGRHYRETRERLGPEGVDYKERERSKGKKRSATPRAIEPESPPGEATTEDETTRAEGLKMIREAAEAIGKIGGADSPTPRRRVVESQEPLPIIETPEGMEDETIEKEQRLRDLSIVEEKIAVIINAWLCIKTERFDQYALASTLNRLGIDGLDRSKVYQALEVV